MTKRDELIKKIINVFKKDFVACPKYGSDQTASSILDTLLSACPELGEPTQGFDSRVRIVCFNEWLETHQPNRASTFSYGDMKKAYCDAGANGFTAGQAQAGKMVVKGLVFSKEQGKLVARPNVVTLYEIHQVAGLWHLAINGFAYIGDKSKSAQIDKAQAVHKALILAEIEVV